MNNVKILILNYNKKVDETLTFKSINNIAIERGYEVIVWDNSTITDLIDINQSICLNSQFTYFTDNENVSLSYLYNKVVDYCFSQSKDFFLCIFDDDSQPDLGYFLEMEKIITKDDYYFICPKVNCNDKPYSPAKYSYFKNKPILSDSGCYSGALTGVMSGTIIKSVIFEKVRFDESLSFYGIDTKFYLDVTYKKDIPLFLMESSMKHSLSINDTNKMHVSQILMRFLNVKGASSYINKSLGLTYWIVKFFLDLLVSIKLSIKYCNLSFLKRGTNGLSKD